MVTKRPSWESTLGNNMMQALVGRTVTITLVVSGHSHEGDALGKHAHLLCRSSDPCQSWGRVVLAACPGKTSQAMRCVSSLKHNVHYKSRPCHYSRTSCEKSMGIKNAP